MELKLGDVQTTALIPLAIKASETNRKNPRVKDEMAAEIIKVLGVDTAPYDKFLSHEGVIARTVMLDRQLKGIIDKEPETVVINVGAGFDNRFSRMDNGKIMWFDLDLPDAIAARRKAFPERERVTMIPGNALEDGWCEVVKSTLEAAGKGSDVKPVIIAEGLFMYLTMDQIKTFLEIVKANFPGGGLMITELNGKFMQKNAKHHDTIKSTNAVVVSGTDSGQEIADLVPGCRLIEEHSFNEEMKKHTFGGWLFATIMRNVNDRWATLVW